MEDEKGYDGHGSVRFLTDEKGAKTDSCDYDVFGILNDPVNKIDPSGESIQDLSVRTL